MHRTVIRVLSAVGGVCLAVALLPASPAAANPQQTLAECLASYTSGESHACYEMSVVPGPAAPVTVRIAYDLFESGENYDNNSWKGGVWMQRWPIAGQWKKYPKGPQYFPAGKRLDDCSGANISPSNCYKVFSGPKGAVDLVFPPSMAGYVYEIQTVDYACSFDGATCSQSGGSVQGTSYAYAFIFKAFRYKDAKGKWVVAGKCPAKPLRKSACKPAATASLARNIGGGDPVEFSSAS